jgi:uncharacterized protein YukJ
VQSQLAPSEVEYLVDDDFQHPITAGLRNRALGFYRLGSLPTDGGLDYIRGNLFDPARMRPLPMNLPGPDDDLNDQVDRVVQAAIAEEGALIYAFGQRWGPEDDTRDKIFGFLPGNGIHDIHMNQGNSGQFVNDDGVWQDGGLLLYFPSIDRWTAVFLKFQSQSWHTDDATGHAIAPQPGTPPGDHPPAPPSGGDADLRVRIIAALVNPIGGDQGKETVTLLNVTDTAQSLAGWAIANRTKAKFVLTGVIAAGATLTVTLPVNVPLSNDGGLITLLDASGLKVHGVSYTKAQVARQGWTVAF